MISIVSRNHRRSVGYCLFVLSSTKKLGQGSRAFQVYNNNRPKYNTITYNQSKVIVNLLSSRAFANKTYQDDTLDKQQKTVNSSAATPVSEERIQETAPSPTLPLQPVPIILTDDGRPMTMIERTKRFPGAVKQLYKDWMLYRNIEDASRTKRNAWTVDPPTRHAGPETNALAVSMLANAVTTNSSILPFVNDTTPRPGRIPRRQLEHQRRLRKDLAVVSPLVLVWLLPIIGYLPMILAFMAPRQVLSRHFWNAYEIQYYRQLELEQRRFVYARLADLFLQAAAATKSTAEFGNAGTVVAAPAMLVANGQEDAAGPLLDPMPLCEIFLAQQFSMDNEIDQPVPHAIVTHMEQEPFTAGTLLSLDSMSHEYLAQLALAIGVHNRFPFKVAAFLTKYTISPILKAQIRKIAHAVVRDDAMLLMELQGLPQEARDGMIELTDEEVRDACLERGLPVDIAIQDMRTCLSNHVKMVQPVHELMLRERQRAVPESQEPVSVDKMVEGLGLLTLHMPILRDLCQRQQKLKVE